jgi:MOSC domain-containing protein YiiM
LTSLDGAQQGIGRQGVQGVTTSRSVPERSLWRQNDLLAADDALRGPRVLAVHASATYKFSKAAHASITLLEGMGVEGDAHCGKTVQHRYAKRRDPTKSNLQQVPLLQSELFDELRDKNLVVRAGDLGENITTRGLDILALPRKTRLPISAQTVLTLTGLRNPFLYIDRFQKGLLAAVRERAPEGGYLRKTGVMAIVVQGGIARPGYAIAVELPQGRHWSLKPV